MKSKKLFEIPTPCYENWQAMSSCVNGKFCGKCNKTVFDFSDKSTKEIKKQLEKNNKICGRVNIWQLETNIFRKVILLFMGFVFFISGCKQQRHVMGYLKLHENKKVTASLSKQISLSKKVKS